MKKSVSIVLALMLVFGIILASAPLDAQAKPNPTATPAIINPLIAGGSWTSGSSVDVSAFAASAPTWLQLLTGGVKVTEAGKICHPFRGGQFGWVGVIMQYKDGKWIKLTTTNDWVPNKEGEFMSCAQAPAAGTYALFGYWKRPAGYVEVVGTQAPTCNYSTDDWSADLYGEGVYHLEANLPNIAAPTIVSFTFTSQGSLIGPNTGSKAIGGSGWVDFDLYSYSVGPWSEVNVDISALGCTKTITLTEPLF